MDEEGHVAGEVDERIVVITPLSFNSCYSSQVPVTKSKKAEERG
jgi:hypothetical protein